MICHSIRHRSPQPFRLEPIWPRLDPSPRQEKGPTKLIIASIIIIIIVIIIIIIIIIIVIDIISLLLISTP